MIILGSESMKMKQFMDKNFFFLPNQEEIIIKFILEYKEKTGTHLNS